MKKTNKTALLAFAGAAALLFFAVRRKKAAETTTTTGKDKFANGYDRLNPADLTAEKEVVINTDLIDKTK